MHYGDWTGQQGVRLSTELPVSGRIDSPQFVTDTIKREGLTRLYAFNLHEKEVRIGHFEGDASEVAEHVDYLVKMLSGLFRIECGKKGDAVTRGGAGVARSAFVWVLMGTATAYGAPTAPVVPAALPAPVEPKPSASVAPPSGFMSIREHEQGIIIAELRQELRALTHCPHGHRWSEGCDMCDPDEEEEEEEGTTDPDKLRELVTVVRDVFREMRMPTPAQSQAPITGASAARAVEGMTDEDRRTWEAIARMRESDPEAFAGYRAQLLDSFGGDQQPAPDGQ